MRTAIKSTLGVVAIVFLAMAIADCSSAPLESDTASSTVRLTLADAQSSTGVFICAEADVARLRVAPHGYPEGRQNRPLALGESCTVEFTVTVPKGPVDFSGALEGGGRPLMRGAEAGFQARKDGFVVHIDLEEVDALDVRTQTIGTGGPTSYMLEVDRSPVLIPIDRDDADTLAALAAGARFVTLHAEPCVVVNGPARREVMIPTDERVLGATVFEIECDEGTGGGPGAGPQGNPPTGGPPGTNPPARHLGSLKVVLRAVQPPLPIEVTSFEAIVTGLGGGVQKAAVMVGDSVSFAVSPDQDPFTVDLVPTGTCFVYSGGASRTVPLSSDLTGRVVFDIGC